MSRFYIVVLLALASARAHAQEPMSMVGMQMSGPLGISMDRMGSGTTWVPDDATLPSRHFMLGAWGVMLHGFAFGQYDWQQGPRGGDQLGSLNWAMLMVDRGIGGGLLEFRFMPSLDPWTVGKCGYPLLLQSGEECNGQPIIDRQHPHDFFMELSASYQRAITPEHAVFVYVAPAGEPALGPVAFMHRPSAMDNPFAPLGHHWQDATHMAFGVVTTGLYTQFLRIEASAFNGKEPDDNRWDFDEIDINSYSGRITLNPNRSLSVTAGYGRIMGHSAHHAELHRIVLSALYGKQLSDGQWSAALIYGANRPVFDWAHSLLLESEAVLGARHTVFGRAEVVEKSATDLGVSSADPEATFNVGALQLGYIFDVVRGKGATFGLGGSGTLNLVPRSISASYGSTSPLGAMIFLRVRPTFPKSDAMSGMHHTHQGNSENSGNRD